MQSDSNDPTLVKPKCPDCAMCQGCSEVRCRACRGGKFCRAKKKLSLQEQIALYNRLNPGLAGVDSQCLCCSCEQDKS